MRHIKRRKEKPQAMLLLKKKQKMRSNIKIFYISLAQIRISLIPLLIRDNLLMEKGMVMELSRISHIYIYIYIYYIDRAAGSIYMGHWADNQRSGKGSMIRNDGIRYYGDWKKDFIVGKGILSKFHGKEYYCGEVFKGMKRGKGEMKW